MDVGLSLEISRDGPFVIVSVGGVVDAFGAPTLENQLFELIEGGETNIIVDLLGTDLLDSSALGVLLGGLKDIQSKGGTLRIVASSKNVLGVFEITGLSQIFTIYDTLDAALKAEEEQEGDQGKSQRI